MAALSTAMVVVKPLVSALMQKATSPLLAQYKVMAGMEEQHEKLKLLLPAILRAITDAEEQATRRDRDDIRVWLQMLKTAAYESIEVFDEFKYEALRRQAKKEGHYIKLGMDVIKLFPSHNRIAFRYRMGNKLCKIVRDIDALVKHMKNFGFNNLPEVQRPTHSLHEDSSFIQDSGSIVSRSRDEERQKIVKMLVKDQANNKDLMVIPIVGMGGLGKTTLAQLIFNDPQVKKHFQLAKWVCVSDDFDVCNLANKICEATSTENNIEKALQDLKKLLSGKRYLLVLDDVWNEDDDNWAKLKTCLGYGDAGSAILVTTRSKGVARLMSTGTYHDIVVLDRKFIKEIIEIRAFSSQKNKPVGLVDLVDEMANKCFGSPLAAKALGAVLRNKTTVEEWKAVSQRSVICSDENKILPILKLSYDDLPANMKQCFAFCAVFPKDYEIDVDMLIQLWMAIGFIPEQDELCTEGKQIFREMVSRSFFQDVKEVRVDEGERMERYCSRYKRTICKIHDLMHDVALSVMERVSTAILNASMKEMSLAIQTLLCDYRDLNEDLQHVSKYSSLRALKLNVSSSFPMRPKHLHHLRNLDLSRSDIKALPEDISIMYNLQTLNLSDCCYLVRLPKQMRYMTALRHLYIRGCMALKCMPPELGRLNSLKTLTNFVAGIGSDCSNLGELRHLNIGGSLVLNQLENVTEADAKVANLGDKKELRELSLIWTRRETWEISDTEDEHSKTEEHSEIEEQHSRNKVLEGLKSPHGLQALRIVSYQGTTFPTWMGFLQNMV
ncbi:hypothetical protein EJB05_03590, partial [Eragrostis curvula]